jgi:hypothetical protein
LDDDFLSILSDEEKQLRQALQQALELARAGKSSSPVLNRVRAFLSEFGMVP